MKERYIIYCAPQKLLPKYIISALEGEELKNYMSTCSISLSHKCRINYLTHQFVEGQNLKSYYS